MKEKIDSIVRILENEENFLSKLRFLDGFDETEFNKLCSLFEELSKDLKNKSEVPKDLVYLVIDVIPSMVSSSFSYSGKEQEQINLATDKLQSILYDCFG